MPLRRLGVFLVMFTSKVLADWRMIDNEWFANCTHGIAPGIDPFSNAGRS
jgi:hypothetical protein